jgi:RND family efflux transporter MFP subunit
LWPAAFLLAFGACQDRPTPQAPAAAAKPASVKSPVKEAELTTVTLTPEAEKRLGVVTVAVERRSVQQTRTVGAEIAPASGALVAIVAPVAGALQPAGTVPVAGSLVSKGQPLFRLVPLQPSERDAGVDAQQAADSAAARRDMAANRARRAEQLVRDGAGSRRAVEEAQADLAIAEAELKAARERAALATQGGAAGGVGIEAPDSAVVQAVHARERQTVAAGTPLLDLVRLSPVWVRVPIYAGEAGDIDRSASARVVGLGEPATAEGLLAEPIPPPPSANASLASVDLYYRIANSDRRFRPGERVSVRLARRGGVEGLVVPKAALLHDAYGGTWVYVARDAQVFVRQRVAVADVNGPIALLSQGPAPGARVVTDGAAELFGVEFGAGK